MALDLPEYTMKTTAKVGAPVVLDGMVVPKTVVMHMKGGGDINGRKWPDMTYTFTIRDGAAICSAMHIESKPGDRPLRSQDLTFIDVDQMAQLAFEAHASSQESPGAYVHPAADPKTAATTIRGMVSESHREPLAELTQVAAIYCDPAHRKTPAEHVYLGLAYNSRETSNRRIRSARDKHLIPPVGASDIELDEAFNRLTTPTLPEMTQDQKSRLIRSGPFGSFEFKQAQATIQIERESARNE
jgi:hypothetical protein